MDRAGTAPEQRLTAPRTARVFFALWPDDRVRDALYFHAQALYRGCGGRVMSRAKLHLTLVFIGNVARGQLNDLSSVADAISATPFEFVLDRTGYWRHNRIVWASPLTVPGPLRALFSGIEDGLKQAGLDFDHRPYAPHITLLRDARAPAILPPLELVWPVRDFVLVESGRGARGAEYRLLGRWPLDADQR
jgi:2'-5' RNA ligase